MNSSVARVAFTSATVPVKVSVAAFGPPVETVPFAAVTVTVTLVASTSVTTIVSGPVKASVVSSATVWAPGSETVTGSSTGVTTTEMSAVDCPSPAAFSIV